MSTWRRLKRHIRQWWQCRTQRCDYYRDYLAHGPATMPHATYHFVAQQAEQHFRECSWLSGERGRLGFNILSPRVCPRCHDFETRLRA